MGLKLCRSHHGVRSRDYFVRWLAKSWITKIQFLVWVEIFMFAATVSRLAVQSTQLPNHSGYSGLFPRMWNWSHTSILLRNAWTFTSILFIVFVVWCCHFLLTASKDMSRIIMQQMGEWQGTICSSPWWCGCIQLCIYCFPGPFRFLVCLIMLYGLNWLYRVKLENDLDWWILKKFEGNFCCLFYGNISAFAWIDWRKP